MSKQKEKWHVHAEELGALGFSRSLIAEAVKSEELRLFEIEPPEDLVEKTVARCAELYSGASTQAEVPFSSAGAFRTAPGSFVGYSGNSIDASRLLDLVSTQMDTAHLGAVHFKNYCGSLEDPEQALSVMNLAEIFPRVCLGSATFAVRSKQRPVLILENHNLIDPSWWHTDVALRSMRVACNVVNSIVVPQGAPSIGVVVVLRPKITDYSGEDIRVLSDLVQASSFDIWWLPHRLSGSYVDRDVTIVGDENVFSLAQRAKTPWAAACGVHRERNVFLAEQHRAAIEGLTIHATPIRNCQHLFADVRTAFEKPERLKDFLQDVILSKCAKQP